MKKFLCFLLCLAFVPLCFGGQVVKATAKPLTTAKSMIVLETLGNKTLYEHNADEKLPMASTTKIVTAITVIENCENLDELITVPKSATLVEGSSIYLRAGEQLSVRDLLYGLMLQSGNDSAETLALKFGEGDISKFAEMMNQTAEKIGVQNSNFVTPHGLDDKDHYTTARDLALITSYALKNKDFKDIVSCKSHVIKASEHNTAKTLINKNKLLSSMEGCIGVKTGFTKKAGRCLVSACEREGMQVVCVVLNCGPMFEESADLLNLAYNEYELKEILPAYKFAGDVTVTNGEKTSTRVYNKEGFSCVMKKGDAERYTVEYDLEKTIDAPVEKGQKLGEVRIYYDNTLIFSENLCSIEGVGETSNLGDIKNILENW